MKIKIALILLLSMTHSYSHKLNLGKVAHGDTYFYRWKDIFGASTELTKDLAFSTDVGSSVASVIATPDEIISVHKDYLCDDLALNVDKLLLVSCISRFEINEDDEKRRRKAFLIMPNDKSSDTNPEKYEIKSYDNHKMLSEVFWYKNEPLVMVKIKDMGTTFEVKQISTVAKNLV